MVRIRLARAGAKKKPFYRIVATDKRNKRDGRFLEKLGTYDPLTKALDLNKESVQKWLSVGATASETVTKLLIKEGFELKLTFIPKEKQKKKEDTAEKSE
ncbi:30S ribosomal protein S16 [bacterium]|nr:30S ribosomal protein S16 [bacterium]